MRAHTVMHPTFAALLLCGALGCDERAEASAEEETATATPTEGASGEVAEADPGAEAQPEATEEPAAADEGETRAPPTSR